MENRSTNQSSECHQDRKIPGAILVARSTALFVPSIRVRWLRHSVGRPSFSRIRAELLLSNASSDNISLHATISRWLETLYRPGWIFQFRANKFQWAVVSEVSKVSHREQRASKCCGIPKDSTNCNASNVSQDWGHFRKLIANHTPNKTRHTACDGIKWCAFSLR